MKHASVLAVGVLALVASSGCTQAPAPCQIQSSGNGGYLVRLTSTGTNPAGCPPQFADLWTFDPFLDVNQKVLIVGYSGQLGLPPTTDPNYKNSPLYAKGNFTATDPDGNNLCTIDSLSMTDGTTTFAISAMKWLSTARYLGTEFEANVTYTTTGCAGGTYTAQAINPPVTCGANADCDPFAQPISSGINSDYNTSCNLDAWATDFSGDPATGFCFFKEAFPSLGGFKP